MRSNKSDVQQLILNTPSFSYSLNLVVSVAVEASKDAISYFTIIQSIYNFVSGSTRRLGLLQKNIRKKVNCRTTTQFECLSDAE